MPFFLYYWLFALLLPVGKWVIGGGIGLIIIAIVRFSRIRTTLQSFPPAVRAATLTGALVGAIGTTPTSFLYGAIGAELGAAAIEFAGEFLGPVGPGARWFGRAVCGTISLMSLVAWALLLWGIIGATIGWALNAAFRRIAAGTKSR